MFLNELEFQKVAEHLDVVLGREATDTEVLAFITNIQYKQYDLLEEEVKGN